MVKGRSSLPRWLTVVCTKHHHIPRSSQHLREGQPTGARGELLAKVAHGQVERDTMAYNAAVRAAGEATIATGSGVLGRDDRQMCAAKTPSHSLQQSAFAEGRPVVACGKGLG